MNRLFLALAAFLALAGLRSWTATDAAPERVEACTCSCANEAGKDACCCCRSVPEEPTEEEENEEDPCACDSDRVPTPRDNDFEFVVPVRLAAAPARLLSAYRVPAWSETFPASPPMEPPEATARSGPETCARLSVFRL